MCGLHVVALVSGGKDSCFNMMECVRHGHNIVVLANLYPPRDHPSDELDSWAFQTVGHDAMSHYAECMNIPMIRCSIKGQALHTVCDYVQTAGDETEDLYRLLRSVQLRYPEVQAVASGAILSTYQRLRIEEVCSRLGLVSLAYLWQRNQEKLLSEMVDAGLDAILIKVAAYGLQVTQHLGKSLDYMQPLLQKMHRDFGLHICGEGGEYETFTLDCPLFRKSLRM